MSRNEARIATALAAVSLAFRAVAFFHYRFDSDEPQHLHVAWGWTAGLLQYRDVFDNHAPLFHMLTAPLLALAGERSTVLFFMRLPMLVLWAVVLYATYAIAKQLYDARVAAWATLLLAALPPFFLKSIEYRTDNLWNALWMLAALALLRQRHLLAGILLGLAFATSMKTSLLIVTIVIAALVTRTLTRRWLALGVFVLPPAVLAAYFWQRGAWPSLVYCLVTFNESVTKTWNPMMVWLPRLLWVPALATIVLFLRRSFWAAATAVFFATLFSFWILISPRDILPFLPFLAMFAAAKLRHRTAWAVAISLAFVVYYADGFRNRTRESTTMMDQVLGLTRPGEMLMDYKGETVFRPRPYYYILEAIGRRVAPDTVPESIVSGHCYVTQADGPFWTPRTRKFLVENFLDMGRLRAAGVVVPASGDFTIAVPGTYVAIGERGETRGVLDGTPYTGARQLADGPHRFEPAAPGELVAILWAPAFQRGYSPFHRKDREF